MGPESMVVGRRSASGRLGTPAQGHCRSTDHSLDLARLVRFPPLAALARLVSLGALLALVSTDALGQLRRDEPASAVSTFELASRRTDTLPPNERQGVIYGTIVDRTTRDPIPDALLRVTGTSRTARSNETGHFRIPGVASGTRQLTLRRIGYTPLDTTIVVPADDSIRMFIAITQTPQNIGRVVVSVPPQERIEFEQSASPSVLSLSAAAVRSVPAALETDVLRTVQLLPGVAARSDYNAGLNVEGGEPDQNLVLLDGIPILNPFHLGGLFGTFIDGTVERVDLHTAGYGARYGGRMSSVLQVRSAEEARDGVHGTANVSLLSSNATFGGALGSGRGSWNVAARRTYADAFARAAGTRVFPYHFSDGQAHIAYTLPWGTRIAVSGYAGDDVFAGDLAQVQDSTIPGANSVDLRWGNDAAGITLTQALGTSRLTGDSSVLEQRVSASQYSARFDLANGSYAFINGVRQDRVAGSLTRYDRAHTMRAGYDVDRFQAHYKVGVPQVGTAEVQSDQRVTSVGVFVEDEWRVNDRLIVNPGARFETVSGTGWSALSPRISAKYFVAPHTALTAAAGRYAQWVQLSSDENAPLSLLDYWVASDATIPVAYADHYVAGVERWFGMTRFMKLSAFFKPYRGLNAPNPATDPEEPGSEFFRETGLAYGATAFLRQLEVGLLSGWMSYTYGVSRRQRGDTVVAPVHDRRHAVNAELTMRSNGYVVSAHLGYSTGAPYTPVIGEVQNRSYNPITGTWGQRDGLAVYGPRSGRRYPSYQRLDFGVSRTYRLGNANVTPSLNVLNVLNRDNIFAYLTRFNASPPRQTAVQQFPFLPSVGLKVEF
jgi:hypothetical protein